MANTGDSRKLDDLVKETLINYEDSATVPDWGKMEGMLGTAPKSSSFKLGSITDSAGEPGIFKKAFSSYIFIIVIMLGGGGYLLYSILKSPKAPVTVQSSVPVIDSGAANVSSKSPVITKTTEEKIVATEKNINPPKDSVAPPLPQVVTEKLPEVPVDKKENSNNKKEGEAKKENKAKKEPEVTAKTEKKTEKKDTESVKVTEKKKEEPKKPEKKEKEKTPVAEKKEKAPKEALKKSDNAIGLSNFMLHSMNADSIKKQQSPQQPKDSVKTP
jgi:hypothetical protein